MPDDLSGLRNKAILLVEFAGAFRRSEIVGLHVRDVQSSDAGLIIDWHHQTFHDRFLGCERALR